MTFMTLKANGAITNSLRFKEVRNENILRCLTERIDSLDENFTLHSVYLMLKKYPILCNVLDTPDLYAPIQSSPVQYFKSFFKDYKDEVIEPNFINTAHIHQIIAFLKSDYEYKFKDLKKLSDINTIQPIHLGNRFKYNFDSSYEISINKNGEQPNSENEFYRRGISKQDIDKMNHLNPIKVEIGNILFFYSESHLEKQVPNKKVHIEESGHNAISISLIDFLSTIVTNSFHIQ
jgi:hypothetical protein